MRGEQDGREPGLGWEERANGVGGRRCGGERGAWWCRGHLARGRATVPGRRTASATDHWALNTCWKQPRRGRTGNVRHGIRSLPPRRLWRRPGPSSRGPDRAGASDVPGRPSGLRPSCPGRGLRRPAVASCSVPESRSVECVSPLERGCAQRRDRCPGRVVPRHHGCERMASGWIQRSAACGFLTPFKD